MRNQKFVSVVLSVTLSFLGVAVIAYGATTISDNITTAGVLTVTGNSILATASTTGEVKLDSLVVGLVSRGVSMTQLGALSASSTLYVGGASTLVGAVGVTGLTTMTTASTTGDVTLGSDVWFGGFATTTAAGIFTSRVAIAVPEACGATLQGGTAWNNTDGIDSLCICDGTNWILATSTNGTACGAW